MEPLTKQLANTSQTEKVYFTVIEYIQTLVRNGHLTIGDKLPSERQLMETLGLSRNSIREALRSLENIGIIESRHGQGNYLVNHAGKSLGSMFSLLLSMNECSCFEIRQLRRMLETDACLLAAKQAQDADVQALSHILSKMADSRMQERAQLDKHFHDMIIQMCGNRLLMLLNDTLSQLFESSIHEILADISARDWEELLSCHVTIYESLRTRNLPACTTAVMAHYDFIDDLFKKYEHQTSLEESPASITSITLIKQL